MLIKLTTSRSIVINIANFWTLIFWNTFDNVMSRICLNVFSIQFDEIFVVGFLGYEVWSSWTLQSHGSKRHRPTISNCEYIFRKKIVRKWGFRISNLTWRDQPDHSLPKPCRGYPNPAGGTRRLSKKSRFKIPAFEIVVFPLQNCACFYLF